jgi:hypothetical protein
MLLHTDAYIEIGKSKMSDVPTREAVKVETPSGPVFVNDPVEITKEMLAAESVASQLNVYKRRNKTLIDLVDGGKMHDTQYFSENSFTCSDGTEAYVEDFADVAALDGIMIQINEFWESVSTFSTNELSIFCTDDRSDLVLFEI